MFDSTSDPTVPVFADGGNPVLKILFYIDDMKEFDNGSEDFMPRILKAFLQGSGVFVKCAARPDEITEALLGEYHEVWLFLASRKTQALTETECLALRNWMDRGGGVLITGDHADLNDSGEFEGLGRPIGRFVPRARHMRIWDGPPGSLDQYGRIDSTGPGIDSFALEQDAKPQRLELPRDVEGAPHVLFLDAQGVLLDRLPDHRHEGKVLVPATLTDEPNAKGGLLNEWAGSSLLPEIVARGVDKRLGVSFDLMAAWDGHGVRTVKNNADGSWHVCGRILADSSWHHYVNFNLVQIEAKNDPNGWGKIKALYTNIAAWLAPPTIQRFFRERAYAEARPQLEPIDGLTDEQLGARALALFATLLPGAWYHQMIDDRLAEHAAATMQSLPRESVAPLIGASMRRYIAG